MSGELQKARMLRRCCWATAVPIFPGEVPMIADGFRENEFVPHGRLAQSIAFLSAPGIERQVADRDFLEFQLRRRQTRTRNGEFPVNRCLGKAADEIANLECGHVRSG